MRRKGLCTDMMGQVLWHGTWRTACTVAFLLGPVLVREDNEAVIKLTKVPDIPKRSRHIDVKYHFALHLVKAKHAKLRYLQTELMTADIFTKPLGPKRFAFLRDRLLGRTTTGQDAIED